MSLTVNQANIPTNQQPRQAPEPLTQIDARVQSLTKRLGWDSKAIDYEHGKPTRPPLSHAGRRWADLRNGRAMRKLRKITAKTDKLAVLRLGGRAFGALVFNLPQLIISGIVDTVLSITRRGTERRLSQLKDHGVLTPVEHLELMTLVHRRGSFRIRLLPVIERLAQEGYLSTKDAQELDQLTQKSHFDTVLQRLLSKGKPVGLFARISATKEEARSEIRRSLDHLIQTYPHLAQSSHVKRLQTALENNSLLTQFAVKHLVWELSRDEKLSSVDRAIFRGVFQKILFRPSLRSVASYLRGSTGYAQHFQDLREISQQLMKLRRELLSPGAKENTSPEQLAQLRHLEASLVDLHLSHGLVMQGAQKDFYVVNGATQIIGEFHAEWAFINDILSDINRHIFGDRYTHLTSGDSLSTSPKGYWPVKNNSLELLEGKTIEHFAVDDDPITVTRPHAVQDAEHPVRSKPLIAGFYVNVGSGHRSGLRGIAQSLPDCNVQAVDVFGDLFSDMDKLKHLDPSLGLEGLPNDLARHENNRLLNLSKAFPEEVVLAAKSHMVKVLSDYVEKERPDMLLSAIPGFNAVFLEVAKKYNLPLLVVTTDIETSNFMTGLKPRFCDVDYPNYRITIPFQKEDCEEGVGKIHPSVNDHLVYNFGYPTRRAFSREISEDVLNELRQEYDIQPDENVALVMMGGNTAEAATSYVDLLTGMSSDELDRVTEHCGERKKLRVICLCGDTSKPEGRAFQDKLNAFNERGNPRVHIHATKGTPRIAELLSLPEMKVLVSKPGGASTNEAFKKKMPMLFHVGGILLDWERFNKKYGIRKGYGSEFTIGKKRNLSNERRKLAQTLGGLFKRRDEMLSGEHPVPEAEIPFTQNLRDNIRQMLQNS